MQFSGGTLGFAASIAADGDYAFLRDSGNQRLVRVKFIYAAEAECDLKR